MKKGITFFALLLAIVSAAFANTNKQQMQFKLFDKANGEEDLTTIYFAAGTSTTYAYPEDAQKSMDTVQGVPQLYSLSSNNVACYSNGYGDFTATTVIALGLRVPADTNYVLSLAGSTNFDASTLILLEDRQVGTFTNLRNGSALLNIPAAGSVTGRFYLHVTFPPVITTVASGCNNDNGAINIMADSSIAWSTCTLYDSTTLPIKTYSNIAGNFSFGSLPEGAYSVVFDYNTYLSAKPIQLGGHQIEAAISASVIDATVGENINFSSATLNTTNYLWYFGDSSTINGIANPTYAYTATGNYIVTMVASNSFGCSVTTSLDVSISAPAAIASVNANNITVTNDYKTLRINVADITGNNCRYELYNIAGQMLLNGPVTATEFTVNVSTMPSGIYLVWVKSNTGAYTKKIVLAQ